MTRTFTILSVSRNAGGILLSMSPMTGNPFSDLGPPISVKVGPEWADVPIGTVVDVSIARRNPEAVTQP